jgi:hypothetical protein
VDGEQFRTRAGRGKAAKAASPKAAAARKTLRSGGRG